MNKSLLVLLQIVVIFIGVSALMFLIVEPHFEGRNIGATPFEIYFKDLFLAYAYIASIPFFMALYHVFRLLGYARENMLSSQLAAKALRTIQYCAIISICFVLAGENIFILSNDSDDRAGGVFMGILITFIWTLIIAIVRVFERSIQKVSSVYFTRK